MSEGTFGKKEQKRDLSLQNKKERTRNESNSPGDGNDPNLFNYANTYNSAKLK